MTYDEEGDLEVDRTARSEHRHSYSHSPRSNILYGLNLKNPAGSDDSAGFSFIYLVISMFSRNFAAKNKKLSAMKDNQQEIFPIVDEEGTVVGKATRGECHSGTKLLHPVVHLHVFNEQGDVYLQKRPEWKDIQPGKWDTAVGGHIDYGETPEEALHREVREELGITDFEPQKVGKYVFESQRERELVYVNCTTYSGTIQPSKDELDGGRFWTMQEISDAMGKNILTPNFESEFKRFFLEKIEITD